MTDVAGISGLQPNVPLKDRARTPEQAAEQFEEVFVKQFVKTMTNGLFDESLAGDDAPGLSSGYADMQKDTLAETLTKYLVDSDAIGLKDVLLRQWGIHSHEAGPDDTPGTLALPGETAPMALPDATEGTPLDRS